MSTNIAIENPRFIDELPIKSGDCFYIANCKKNRGCLRSDSAPPSMPPKFRNGLGDAHGEKRGNIMGKSSLWRLRAGILRGFSHGGNLKQKKRLAISIL